MLLAASPLALARVTGGQEGAAGIFPVCSLWAKRLYWHNLLVGWKQQITHPAAFNSSRPDFVLPHPLVSGGIQGCPGLGEAWAKPEPGNPHVGFVPI